MEPELMEPELLESALDEPATVVEVDSVALAEVMSSSDQAAEVASVRARTSAKASQNSPSVIRPESFTARNATFTLGGVAHSTTLFSEWPARRGTST